MSGTVKKLSFEEALEELEHIVRRLEEGKVPLEEAIQAYERGASLRQHCEGRLAEAKMRVDKISAPSSEDGSPTLEPFESTSGDGNAYS